MTDRAFQFEKLAIRRIEKRVAALCMFQGSIRLRKLKTTCIFGTYYTIRLTFTNAQARAL